MTFNGELIKTMTFDVLEHSYTGAFDWAENKAFSWDVQAELSCKK